MDHISTLLLCLKISDNDDALISDDYDYSPLTPSAMAATMAAAAATAAATATAMAMSTATSTATSTTTSTASSTATSIVMSTTKSTAMSTAMSTTTATATATATPTTTPTATAMAMATATATAMSTRTATHGISDFPFISADVVTPLSNIFDLHVEEKELELEEPLYLTNIIISLEKLSHVKDVTKDDLNHTTFLDTR